MIEKLELKMRDLKSGSWPTDLTLERVRRLHLDTDVESALSIFAIMPRVFPELESLSLTCEDFPADETHF